MPEAAQRLWHLGTTQPLLWGGPGPNQDSQLLNLS